jgi:hypothetical protein
MLKLAQVTSGGIPPSTSDLQHKSPSLLGNFVRRDQLATELGVSGRTLSRWQALRRGPPRVCVGRMILYDVEAVRAWLRSKEEHLSVSKNSRR